MKTLPEVLEKLRPKQINWISKTVEPSPMSISDYQNMVNYCNNLQLIKDCSWDKELISEIENEITRIKEFLTNQTSL